MVDLGLRANHQHRRHPQSPADPAQCNTHRFSKKIFSRLVSETILSEIARGVIEVRLIA